MGKNGFLCKPRKGHGGRGGEDGRGGIERKKEQECDRKFVFWNVAG